MADHLETNGSANLRVFFINDEKGREVKKDTLFGNLYDFWTFYWYGQKIWMLEMSIRRKQKPQALPLVNIILKNDKENDQFLNPQKYLEEVDQEKYFELLRDWKDNFEKTYLEEYAYLSFSSVRHEKALWDARRRIKGLRV